MDQPKNKLSLKHEDAQKILDYLSRRPYLEVHELCRILLEAPEIKDKDNEKATESAEG